MKKPADNGLISGNPTQTIEVMSKWIMTFAEGRELLRPPASIASTKPTSRELADSLATWQRWHEPRLDVYYDTSQWRWYSILEQARVEALGISHLPGMAHNLSKPHSILPKDSIMLWLYLAARAIFSGINESCPYDPMPLTHRESGNKLKLLSVRIGIPLPWLRKSFVLMNEELCDEEIAEALIKAKEYLADALRFSEQLRPLILRLSDLFPIREEDSLAHFAKVPINDRSPLSKDISQDCSPKLSTRLLDSPRLDHDSYKVFSSAWDQELPATYWSTPKDASALDELIKADRSGIRKLANRLRRRLLASSLRRWCFDQEDGFIDNRKLARLIASDNDLAIFRTINEGLDSDVCVVLLVDQSGSMRKIHRQISASAIDLAVQTLEFCKISCEVLGYSTRYGSQNPLLDEWRKRGHAPVPGRLNALQHIIYKTSAQTWRKARRNLGLLLRSDFGKENIDGEAIIWAAKRLAHQPQKRRIILVLTDGSPQDEATSIANGHEYLENHLREVLASLEANLIEVVAIGTSHDVGRFYQKCVMVSRPNAVAQALFDNLGDLLTHRKFASLRQ
jgi:cobaltochelatase CobT